MFSNDLTVIFGFSLSSYKIILLIDVTHQARTRSAKVALCTEPTVQSFKIQFRVVIPWFHVIRIKLWSRRVTVKYASLQPHFLVARYWFVCQYRISLCKYMEIKACFPFYTQIYSTLSKVLWGSFHIDTQTACTLSRCRERHNLLVLNQLAIDGLLIFCYFTQSYSVWPWL